MDTFVAGATQDDHDRMSTQMEAAIGEMGAPPDGLQVQIVHPADDGLRLVGVRRTEAETPASHVAVLLPTVAAPGFQLRESAVQPGLDARPSLTPGRPPGTPPKVH